VFLGTLYPLFMDALGFGKLSVGPPYFNTVFVPLMTPVVLMMGLGPIARWKQASLPDMWTRVRWALAASVVIAILLPLVMGKWTPLVALGILLAFWVFATTLLDLHKRLGGHSGNRELDFVHRLKKQSLSYYGMQLAHIGIGIFIIGVTLVKGYETERDVRMNVGDTVQAGGYEFTFDGVREQQGPNYVASQGRVTITKDGQAVTQLFPEKRQYNSSSMPMTIASIQVGVLRDLYVSLGEPIPDSNGAWAVRVYIKPFVDWIWVGCVLMALGGVFAICDRRYRIHAKKHNKTVDNMVAGKAATLVVEGKTS
jgi:cytochrome c-type biogenesis protein CcmF